MPAIRLTKENKMTDINPAQQSGLLRVVACGSVGDGKTALVDQLLSTSRLLSAAHAAAPPRHATERDTWVESGIPIGIPWRNFTLADRSFAVADARGDEAHVRDTAIALAGAELALVLVDARNGLQLQTRRHSRIASMFGIRQVVVAINKMDLAGWDEARYRDIERDTLAFAQALEFDRIQFVPISALGGDNVAAAGERSPWYHGPTLVQLLQSVAIPDAPPAALRMPVQSVHQGDSGTRAVRGRIAAGTLRRGDRVRIVPSGASTTVTGISNPDGELPEAQAGQAVSLSLADAVEVNRGDVLTTLSDPVEAADQFEARLIWLSPQPLIPERQHGASVHTQQAAAAVTRIKYRVDIDSGQHLAANSLALNDIADINLSFDRPVAFEPYSNNRTLGTFVLEDRLSKDVLAIGTLRFALRRATNVHWQEIHITPQARAEIKGQAARCFWFTGLPSSGKSTIANLMEKRLHAAGKHTTILDGDNVRHGLNRDLGFTEADRVENIRRVAEVARLMVDSGLIVIVSFISPFKAEREFARGLFKQGQFVEVFVDTSLASCEQRDPKGLYAKARSGALKNFTGYDSPYEAPERPEVWLKTAECAALEAAERLAAIALADEL